MIRQLLWTQKSMMASKSNAQFPVAFRRLVYNFSQQLSKEECQAIVYIRLHECRERYRDASNLDVLSKLEMCGVFSLSNPTGLIDVAKDINRSDLVNLVKDFMKSKSKEKKSKGKIANKVEKTNELCDKEMARLRPAVEVTLSQTSALAQLVDTLQRAVESRERQKATEASQKTGRVVNKLVEHLEKVQETLKPHISPQSSTSSCSSGEDTCKPPAQETCDDPAQTLASILQQGIPMADWQRNPPRWAKPTEYHSSGCSQSAPCSPYLGRDSSGRRVKKTAVLPQTATKKPMTPPAMRPLPPTVPTRTLVNDSEGYATLCSVINDDDVPTTSGTGDSGYGGAEEWKQHMHHPPPNSEGHYYKSLHKDEIIEDGVYEKLQQ